jgi:TPR repeat protein
MSERQCTCNWRGNLIWALIGAFLGTVMPAPMEQAKDMAYEWLYRGRALYDQASALRGEAALEGSEAKHRAANAAFERSWDAGVPEALAQLGIAHCNGLGVPRSWRRGHAMLIEAVRRDGRLGAIYLGDPDVCPKAK